MATIVDGAKFTSLPAWIKLEFLRERGFYIGFAAFVFVTIILAALRGETLFPHLAEYGVRLVRVLAAAFSGLLIVLCLRALILGGNGSLLGSIFASAKSIIAMRFARFVYACVLLTFFMAAFLYHKTNIPIVTPFQWDATFAHWESAMLGGRQPWELIHPLVGYPPVTIALDLIYSSWVVMVFMVWAGLLVSARTPRQLRMRYWRATIISWLVIGVVMAMVFSSAGPCFFGDVVPAIPNPFAGLDQYLARVNQIFPLSQMVSRNFLWDVYTGQSELPGGISAMPSMHNAQAALFVAVGFSLSSRLGAAMLVYAILIFVGSIHLGWHYALDGIVGWIAAAAIWLACGWRLRKPDAAIIDAPAGFADQLASSSIAPDHACRMR